MRELTVIDLGLRDYGEVYAYQKKLVQEKKTDKDSTDYLIFVEHPEVYTFGRRSAEENKNTLPQTFEVERGGQATYHNPGQLVAYPLLLLENHERDLHKYLRNLESVIIDSIFELGISGESEPGATGVWILGQKRKIASIGVAVSSWVTYHGIALNVCNDLSGFYKINPCGFSGEVMTSLQKELKEAPPMETVKALFLKHFLQKFSRSLRNSPGLVEKSFFPEKKFPSPFQTAL